MQFKTIHWLSHPGIRASIMLYMFGKRTREFLWRLYLYFYLVFCILGAFLNEMIIPDSRLLDMR